MERSRFEKACFFFIIIKTRIFVNYYKCARFAYLDIWEYSIKA